MKIRININGVKWRVRVYTGRLFLNGEEFDSLIDPDSGEIRIASKCTPAMQLSAVGQAITSIVENKLQPTGRGF